MMEPGWSLKVSPPSNCILYIFTLHLDGDEKSFSTILFANTETDADHERFRIHFPIFPLILLVKCEHIHLLSWNPENSNENFGVFSYLKCFSFACHDIFRLIYLKRIQEKTVI